MIWFLLIKRSKGNEVAIVLIILIVFIALIAAIVLIASIVFVF